MLLGVEKPVCHLISDHLTSVGDRLILSDCVHYDVHTVSVNGWLERESSDLEQSLCALEVLVGDGVFYHLA